MTIGSAIQGVARPSGWKAWFLDNPRRPQLALDGTAVVLAVASFAQIADPDVLLHCIWVVLSIEAFLYGFRFTIVRIVLATFLVLSYATIADRIPNFIELELTEWPLMTMIAVVVAIMADQLASTSRRYANLYREASNRLLTAQEDERLRLARDLHDGVGQTLTALTFTLDAAEAMLWAGEQAPSHLTRSSVVRAQELAAIALDETRDVAFRLRPGRFAETGLAAGIQELAATVGTIDLRIEPGLIRPHLLEAGAEMEVYRIVQEALGNAVRYAGATHIWVELSTGTRSLLVTVGDDGVGFDPSLVTERGLGLAGMRERALLLDTDLTVQSAPGRGTIVTLAVPFGEPSSETQAAGVTPVTVEAAIAS